MSTSFRAVIFDWGGVFQQTTDYGPRHKWDDHLGMPHGSVERLMFGSESWKQTQLGVIPTDEHWKRFGKSLKLTVAETDSLRADFFNGDAISENVVVAARLLKERNFPVALMSNNYAELPEFIAAVGCSDLFDEIVISAAIGVMKPEAPAYQAALDALGVTATQTVFIDDSAVNIDAAITLGMQVIHYNSRLNLLEELFPEN